MIVKLYAFAAFVEPYARAFVQGAVAVVGAVLWTGGHIDGHVLTAASGAGLVAVAKLAKPQPKSLSSRLGENTNG